MILACVERGRGGGGITPEPVGHQPLALEEIVADSGNDRIQGAAGNDILTGGSGADTFVYYSNSITTHSGTDHITDFNVHQDRIEWLPDVPPKPLRRTLSVRCAVAAPRPRSGTGVGREKAYAGARTRRTRHTARYRTMTDTPPDRLLFPRKAANWAGL